MKDNGWKNGSGDLRCMNVCIYGIYDGQMMLYKMDGWMIGYVGI